MAVELQHRRHHHRIRHAVMRIVDSTNRMREGVDRTEPLLEGRGTHGRRRHHVGAGLDVGAVVIGARQELLDQPHAFERDALAHGVVEGRGIGFEAMRERVHASAGRDHFRHADGQFRVADDDARQEFRMEDDLLHMGFGIGDDRSTSDFRAGTGGGRYGHDRRDGIGIRTRPPVTDILEIPDRPRLASHEGNALAKIEARAAAKGDNAVMAAVIVGLDSGFEVLLVRVRVDIGEQGTAEAGLFKDVERRLRDPHGCETPIGDQQRLLHAERLAGVRQFLDPATSHRDGGGIAPIGDDVHFVTFFRW